MSHPLHTDAAATIGGLVLAGGRGLRMGGCDKSALAWRGETFAAHLIRLLRPRVRLLALNTASADAQISSQFDACIADQAFAGEGPLAGLLAGLKWAAAAGLQRLLVVPCDTPALSGALLDALLAASQQGQVALLTEGSHWHPLHLCLPTSLAGELHAAMAAGERSVQRFLGAYSPVLVDAGALAKDLLNVNTPDVMRQLERR